MEKKQKDSPSYSKQDIIEALQEAEKRGKQQDKAAEDYKVVKDKEGKEYRVFNSTASHRLLEYNETREEYKIRRRYVNKLYKRRMNGAVAHNSSKEGTYIKPDNSNK